VAKKYNIETDGLKEAVTRYGIAGASRVDTSVFRERRPNKSPEEEKANKQLIAERLLITWLINENSLFDILKGQISAEDFFEPVYHDIVEALFQQYETEGKVTPAAIMDHYQSKEEHDKVSAIMQQDFDMEVAGDEKSKTITDLVKGIKRRSIEHQMEAAKGDLTKKGQLMMEQKRLDQLVIRI
jgi:DNA primase